MTSKTLSADGGENTRLDKFLSNHLPELSRTKIQKMINDGLVYVNHNFERCSLDLYKKFSPISYEDCMKKDVVSCSSTSNALLDRVCHAGYPTDDFSNASLTDNAKKNCSNCKINNNYYSRMLKCDCNNTIFPLILDLNVCNIDSWSEFNFGKKVKKKHWHCFARSFRQLLFVEK